MAADSVMLCLFVVSFVFLVVSSGTLIRYLAFDTGSHAFFGNFLGGAEVWLKSFRNVMYWCSSHNFLSPILNCL